MRTLLFGLLLLAPALSAQETAMIEAPQHFDTVAVVIAQTDEVRDLFRGPDTAAVRRHVQQQLTHVGITVLPDSVWKLNPRIPFLYVQVDALKNGHNWYCSAAAALFFGKPFEGDSTLVGWKPRVEGHSEEIVEGTPTTVDVDAVVDGALEELAAKVWPTR